MHEPQSQPQSQPQNNVDSRDVQPKPSPQPTGTDDNTNTAQDTLRSTDLSRTPTTPVSLQTSGNLDAPGSGSSVVPNDLALPTGITIIPPSPLTSYNFSSNVSLAPGPSSSSSSCSGTYHPFFPSQTPSTSPVARPSTQRLRSSTFSPPPTHTQPHRRDETLARTSARPTATRSHSHIVTGKRPEPPIATGGVAHHPLKLKRLSIDESARSYSIATGSDAHTPIQENSHGHSGIHRRRPSITNGSHQPQTQITPRSRQQSVPDTKIRSPIIPPASSSAIGWLTGTSRLTLPPTHEKHSHSKSDDERETDEDQDQDQDQDQDEYYEDDDSSSQSEYRTKKSKAKFDWRTQMPSSAARPIQYGESSSSAGASGATTPSISMTPPDSKSSTMPLPPPSSLCPSNMSPPRSSGIPSQSHLASPPHLQPLPQDPYNILPLSLPPSPFASPAPSRAPTPLHSAHPSMADLAAEYAASALPPAPSGSGSSPRTSISTSSSRYGWGTGRSDSRSSEDDDVVPPIPISTSTRSHRTWWTRVGGHGNEAPVSPKISGPGASAPRIMRISPTNKFVPSGTRNWGWLFEILPRSLGLGPTRTEVPTTGGGMAQRKNSISAKARNRERDKLMTGPNRRRRDQKVLGSKWLARAMMFVPTQPLSISLFLMFFAVLAVTLTFTIKHILNPDKEPLPWRQYCTSNYPTLYSLQDPTLPPPHVNSGVNSNPAFPSSSDADIPFNSFAPSSKSLTLMPLTPSHPAWPYHPHPSPPFSAEMSVNELDDALDPVGVLIGVFTTDAGAERRHMIRQSYASHWRSRREGTEGVRVRFVMGRPRKRYEKAVQLEMEAFNDILLLDMEENMNSGKTHAFFSWAAENATVPSWEYPKRDSESESGSESIPPAPVWKGEKKPSYVVKADDDAFIMLTELEKRLRVAPRNKAFWGYLVKNTFMAGECYALSFDLVQYIGASPALRTLTRGKEDKLVAKWMNMHPEREQIVWVTERCWIYDHPKAGTVYSHGFLFPSTVAEVRAENATGLSASALAVRGGADSADAYSTVSKFGVTYRPLSEEMSAGQRVEALIEGSALSRLTDEIHSHSASPSSSNQQAFSRTESTREKINRVYAGRPSRAERFMGDPEERGGTVLVHYIKKPEWFVETSIALLGGADDQAVWHKGVGMGLGALERRKGRVAKGMDEGRLESVKVKVVHGHEDMGGSL